MLYRFQSRETAPVVLLAGSGERILRIIGKSPAPEGIIEVARLREAIDALEAAVRLEAAEAEDAAPPREDAEDGFETEAPVTLRQRAWPLIDMMQRSHAAGCDVVWSATSSDATAAGEDDPAAREA
jgi:hypothetical protein